MIKVKIFLSTALLATFSSLNFNFKFTSQSSTLKLSGASAKLELDTPYTGFDGTLDITNKSATSLVGTTPATDTLAFSDGILQSGSSRRAYLTGTMQLDGAADKLILDTGQKLEVENGTISEEIEVKNGGNSIKGTPVFSSAVVLENASAALSIGIFNKLTQNITLNDGTLTLDEDLSLGDNVLISGDGTINLNNKTLSLPRVVSTPWTGTQTLQNANDIELNGYTTFNGTWNLSGTVSRLNGNGNILDIGGGGTVAIPAAHTLYMTDVHIKDLGALGGSITFADDTSILRLSNCVIELAGNFTLDAGKITVEGNNCVVIARNGNQFLVDDGPLGTTTPTLEVDGVVLLYDPLGTSPVEPDPFVESNDGVISLINDGVIRTNFAADAASPSIEYVLANPTDNILTGSHILSSEATITFKNSTPGTPKAMTLDGQGNWIQFNYQTGQHLILEENITLTLKNIELKDFDPSLISFAGAGATKSKLEFGDNAQLSLSKDQTIGTDAWTFTGNGTLLGNGHTLTLTASDMLTIDNASKTLKIKDAKIATTAADGLHCLNDDSIIRLQDSEISMDQAGLTFDTGNIEVEGFSSILGAVNNATTGTSEFSFDTKGSGTILSGATLKIGRGAKFTYDADVTDDAGDPAVEKYHFTLTDPSSKLWLDTCFFESGANGFALDHGTLYIDGKVDFTINAAAGAEVEFGSALNVEIAPAGILEVDGTIKYNSTTYP